MDVRLDKLKNNWVKLQKRRGDTLSGVNISKIASHITIEDPYISGSPADFVELLVGVTTKDLAIVALKIEENNIWVALNSTPPSSMVFFPSCSVLYTCKKCGSTNCNCDSAREASGLHINYIEMQSKCKYKRESMRRLANVIRNSFMEGQKASAFHEIIEEWSLLRKDLLKNCKEEEL